MVDHPFSSASDIDESRPFPPRFHWLKRLSIFGFLLLLSLGGLRAWWGHESQRRIDALVAEAHARGAPILPEDFAPREIPDSDNAAILYQQACQKLRWTQAENSFAPAAPYTAADFQLIATMMSAHATELNLMRQARARHDADWGYHVTRPLLNYPYLHYPRNIRNPAYLLFYAAKYQQSLHDHSAAVEYSRDMLAFGKASVTSTIDILGLLIGQGLESMGANTVIEIAQGLVVAQPGKGSNGDATPAQIRAMIAELLDETRFETSVPHAWAGEQMYAIGAAPEFVQAEFHPAALGSALWPMVQLQSYRTAMVFGVIRAANQQANYPAAIAMLPPMEDRENESAMESLVRENLIWGSRHAGPVAVVYQLSALRRIAATMLAIRLYEAEHGGRLPETLGELTPNYLSTELIDPYSPTNQAFHYLPHRDPPAIYSVGPNGTDEGGSTISLYQGSTSIWHTEDSVFPLRAPSAATQPANAPQ